MKNALSSLKKTDELYRIPALAAAGLLLSLTSLLGRASPYPLVFLSAVSGFDCLYALTGTLAGYLIRGGFSGFAENLNLIVVMCVITVFRFFAAVKIQNRFNSENSDISKNSENSENSENIYNSANYSKNSRTGFENIVCAVLAGAGLLITAPVFAPAASSASSALITPAFALIAALGSLAAAKTRALINSGRVLTGLKPSEYAALGFTYVLLIAALCGFEPGNTTMLNAGVFAVALVTAVFSYKFGYAAGSVCGAAGAFGIILTCPEYAAAALAICFAGISAPLFSRLNRNKYTHMAGFVLSTGIFAAFSGIDNFTFAEINSIMAGGVVFIFMPVNLITSRFRREVIPKNGADVSEIFARRLRLTGEAMGDVRGAIEKTAEILDRAGSKDISWVYNTACGEVCRRCRHNMTCWGSEYGETVRVMSDVTSLLKKGKVIKPEHLYGPLAYRCGKREQLSAALNTQYREFTAINTANRKIAQMRTILLSQISATQTMMLGMSGEFGSSSGFDRAIAFTVENILFENGVREPKAAATLIPMPAKNNHAAAISNSRLSIEAYGKGKLKCSPEKLCDLLCSALRREFDLPEIIHSNGEFLMTMFERAAFAIEYGAYQVSRGKEKNCGDYFDSFTDKKGFAYIILSDGMGSGGRARIDSAFACGMLIKLLRAGVDINAAIEIINNSLLVKSADESFATLDVCKIDLYSGDVELYKAGSAPTYISCNRRVVKAGGKGLPVGINHRPSYARQTFTIGERDLIIMASDGAELSERWLEHELRKNEWGNEDMNSFAETIATTAKFSTDKEREDDISVIAVKLVK